MTESSTVVAAPRRPNTWPLVLFTLLAGMLSLCVLRPSVLDRLAIPHLGVWFLDTYALLAATDAQAAGMDPYAINPLDHLGRPHGYPSWWLYLGRLGLTRDDHRWVGLVVVVVFLVVAVAWLRPRSRGETLWYAAIGCSPPVVFALERANNDLVVFVLLAGLVPCLRSASPLKWLLALAMVIVATALKFYPLVAVLLLLPGADRRAVGRNALWAGLAIALVSVNLVQEWARFQTVAPHPRGLVSFGATAYAPVLRWTGPGPMLVAGVAAFGLVAWWWRSRWFDGWRVAEEDRSAWLGFTLGAVLLTGCFFAGLNYTYRFVLALWLAPLLWRLPRDERAPRAVRRLAGLTAVLLVTLLWITPVLYSVVKYVRPRYEPLVVKAWAEGMLLGEQPLMWLLFACLLGFLTFFAREIYRTVRGSAGSG